MPSCRVDSTTSTTYTKLLSKITPKNPDLAADLQALYTEIGKDRHAIGDCIPRLKDPKIAGKMWKFRVPDKAGGRGKSGGYRVIGYFDETTNTMYMVLIYHKGDKEDVTRDECYKLVNRLEVDITSRDAATSATEPELPFSQSSDASPDPTS